VKAGVRWLRAPWDKGKKKNMYEGKRKSGLRVYYVTGEAGSNCVKDYWGEGSGLDGLKGDQLDTTKG